MQCAVRELGALLCGHASSQTTPRRPHTTLMTSTQCPNTWAVPPRNNITHFVLAGPTRPCATSGCPAGRARSHGCVLKPTNAPWRELGGTASGHLSAGPQRRRRRRQPSRRPSRERAEPRHAHTAVRTRGSHRPTRLQLRADLESRATRGRCRSSSRCGDAEPSAASPRARLAHRFAPAEGTGGAHVSVSWRG